jgi:hypothetical protein
MICVVGLAQMSAQSRGEPKTITITGTLERVAGVGGETTGWAVRLDSATEVLGKSLKSIEISGDHADFSKLDHKHVEATGKPGVRRGIERGEWPVLEVISIKEIVPKH